MTMTEDRKTLGLNLCPFCGGPARFGKCVPGEQEGENDGAEYVECCDCGASTCLVFPLMDSAKQVLRDMWNRRTAAREAGPDWYARGQDWGLADALTAGQDGDWTLDDIARAFAAGAQAGGALESKRTHEVECRCVALEEQADLTAIHLARMQSALQDSGSRSADYLRKAIKAEAEVALLREALNGGNVIERLQFALQRLADAADTLGVNHFGDDWLSDEVQELQAATHAARLALGPNAELTGQQQRKTTDD